MNLQGRGVPPSAQVLVVGGGTGDSTLALARQLRGTGAQVTGTGWNWHYVKLALNWWSDTVALALAV